MILFLFLSEPDPDVAVSKRRLFLESLGTAALALVAAWLLFRDKAGLVSIFLMTLAQSQRVETLLQRNSRQIWSGAISSGRANRELAQVFFYQFAATFLLFWCASASMNAGFRQMFFPYQVDQLSMRMLLSLDFGTLRGLFYHNSLVLLAFMIGAFLYRGGGVYLILSWNASVWGVVLGMIYAHWFHTHTNPLPGIGAMLAILPHLLTEAFGYVLGGMAGVFLSKAMAKYSTSSPEFRQVLRSVLRIGALAVAFVGLGAALEAIVAPALLRWLFAQ